MCDFDAFIVLPLVDAKDALSVESNFKIRGVSTLFVVFFLFLQENMLWVSLEVPC